ncbi:MAG: ribosome biogenesis/translation initiation ATPase RLI [Nanoarchaeota archaeon]|nr:ribosome biogenesis/translation initiation ATPase RLI [Nanoarchaeota archaeon]MBU1321050.1 ribosome biogenesis/translation initiation ATPase RLI [Nanoarchaeota archaeon]MBU1598119.1 ribosome biogenesis/translation initiation ATPase RLI [Nanoarchaeota archaeon]MBU2442317.1 ribosome biogenesis/translation initiation ATPase RLI [Nanoarchaeota archaeon]
MTRLAIVDNNKLKDMALKKHIQSLCPVNRTGSDCMYFEGSKLLIDEALCIGCGICTKPALEAIHIVNLPEELKKEPVHRYGKNGFALYSLPIPINGKVVGIVGKNGIGKTTALKILAGIEKPNFGIPGAEASYDELIDYFKGSEAQGFFEKLKKGEVVISYKPQQVDLIPKQYKGTVKDLLVKVDEKKELDKMAEVLELKEILDHDISKISGGELQRVAIAACVLKKANVYFFDEPTSFLDVKQRLKISQFIRNLVNEETGVIVVEHDLIILDYMADLIHLMYGKPGAFGVVSQPKSAKGGINVYLSGFLKEENVRFRDETIKFEARPPIDMKRMHLLTEWEGFKQKLESFELVAEKGNIYKQDIVGVLGENGIGKTTFVRVLAGEIKGHELEGLGISYKPQYLDSSDELVMSFIPLAVHKYDAQLVKPLGLKNLLMRKLNELSGGELQRVWIAKCLSEDSDLILMDEPSAYLDVEQRLSLGKIIRDMLKITGRSALIVDHDLLFIDTISDRLTVFEGKPAVHGKVTGPFPMEEGMNHFLDHIDVTFRRDEESKRPRINKLGSQKDKEQKRTGKLYYS